MMVTIPVAQKRRPARRGWRMTPERRQELHERRSRYEDACPAILGATFDEVLNRQRRGRDARG